MFAFVFTITGDGARENYLGERWKRDGLDPSWCLMSNAPIHTVQLDTFYMDGSEVTAGSSRKFVQQSRHSYDKWNDVAKY